MSTKLDQSLDDIVSARRGSSRRGRGGRPVPRARTNATVAPIGGVAKTTRANKNNVGLAVGGSKLGKGGRPIAPVADDNTKKIIVSGLPSDVTEQQIKDYFQSSCGPVHRVYVFYNQTGRSTGRAEIMFRDVASVEKSIREVNGLKVDNRPIRIEVVLGANQISTPAGPKGIGERVTKGAPNKTQPKSAAAPAGNTGGNRGARAGRGRAGRGRGRGGRGGNSGRETKSSEQLDAEMDDYFEAPGGAAGVAPATTNGTTQAAPATGGDTGMDDEIM